MKYDPLEFDPDFDPLVLMSSIFDSHGETMKLSEPSESYGETQKGDYSFIEKQKSRTKWAAIEVINLMEETPNSATLATVRFQLLKSSTSTAANYRAACRARSKNEFFAKMSIVVEESDETVLWLEFLKDSKIKINKQKVDILLKEWDQIMRMMATARKNIYK